MKTLADYVRGYPCVPILLIAEFKHNGIHYKLTKQEGYDSFYFMKDWEVVFSRHYPSDMFPSLAIEHLNHKKDESIISEIHECASYKAFVKFIKEETGQEYLLR